MCWKLFWATLNEFRFVERLRCRSGHSRVWLHDMQRIVAPWVRDQSASWIVKVITLSGDSSNDLGAFSNYTDWFDADIVTLLPLIEAKRDLLLKHCKNPTPETLVALRLARNHAKEECIRCASKFWLDLCSTIQFTADPGNIRAMWEGIKKAIGQTPTKCARLKSSNGEIIQDNTKQLERWVQHYYQLYYREYLVSATALDQIERLLNMPELDNASTLEELLCAIKDISSDKAPGSDGIPAKVFKCGGDQLHIVLYQLLCKCWEEGAVPQEMRDSFITTLYKNNGDRSDCNNYRGISLLWVAGKLFAVWHLVAFSGLQKVWFSIQTLNSWYDFLCETATRKVQGTTTGSFHCLYRCNWGFWSG